MTWQRDESNTATVRTSGRALARTDLRSKLRTRVSRAVKGKPHTAASILTMRNGSRNDVQGPVASHAAPHSQRAIADTGAHLNREHEGYLIKELQHLLRAQIEARIRAKGLWLSFPHSAVLMMLGQQPGLSGAQLARRCSVTAQTMNGLLMPLEKKGLIERIASPENARVLQCYLKGKGTGLMQQCMNEANAVFNLMLGAFSSRERDEFRSILRRCISALQTHAQTAESMRRMSGDKELAIRRASRNATRVNGRGK